MARVITRQGDLVTAQNWCLEGIEEVEAGGDLAELAHGYTLLGTIRRNLGETEDSLEYRRKSLELSQTIENIALQIDAHNNLAVAYYDLGQMDEAISHYTESRELSERIGNLNTAARAEINLGEVHLIRGEWTEAEQAFHQALTIWERNDYLLGQAYGASNMGAVLTRKGMPDEAMQYLQRSHDLFTELGARSFLPIVYRHQAAAHLALGDMNKAQELGLRSLDLAHELALTQEAGAAYRTLGVINRKKNNLVQAEENLERSVEIFREAGVQYEEARARYELARVWQDEQEFDRISAVVDDLIDDFETIGAKADYQLATALKASLPQ